jgi:hypothetical protein
VATALQSNLVARGLDTTQGVLCVLDGSKALRKAARDVLGERSPPRGRAGPLAPGRGGLPARGDGRDPHPDAPGLAGRLKRTLASTNPIESMIECVRRTSRNVKRWQSGEMALRWTAAGMLEAERQFRRIIGYQQLARLAVAIERELVLPAPTEEVATLVNA